MLDGRLQKLFEPLGLEIPAKAMTIDEIYTRFQKRKITLTRGWREDEKHLTLLVKASSDASISLIAFGLVEVAKLDTSRAPCEPNARIIKAGLTHNLEQLIIIQSAEQRSSTGGRLVMNSIDCHEIGKHSEDIRQLTQRMAKAASLLKVAEGTLGKADHSWKRAIALLDSKLKLLAVGVTKEEMVDILLVFLVAGSMTKSMETRIMDELTEHGLKRLAEEVDSTLQLIHEMLLSHFQVALEQCLFIVGELLGLAKSQEVMSQKILGTLIKDTIKEIQTELGSLYLRSELFRTSVVKVETGYRLFFSFLLSIVHHARGKPPNEEGVLHRHAIKIKEFLIGELSSDTIGPELSKETLEKSSYGCEIMNRDLVTNLLGESKWLRQSLRGHLCMICNDWEDLISMLKLDLNGEEFKAQQVCLTKTPCLGEDRDPILCLNIHETTIESHSSVLQIAFPINSGQGLHAVVVLQDCGPGSGSDNLMLKGSVIGLPSGFSLVDVGFQKHESVVLLLQQPDEDLGMLVVASLDKLPFEHVYGTRSIDEELLSNPQSIVQMEDIEGLQQRHHLHPGLRRPMVVSIESIATVFSSNRVVHYDLDAIEDSDAM